MKYIIPAKHLLPPQMEKSYYQKNAWPARLRFHVRPSQLNKLLNQVHVILNMTMVRYLVENQRKYPSI